MGNKHAKESEFLRKLKNFFKFLAKIFIPIGMLFAIIALFVRQSVSSTDKRKILETKIKKKLDGIKDRARELDKEVENIRKEHEKVIEDKKKRDNIAKKYIKDKE